MGSVVLRIYIHQVRLRGAAGAEEWTMFGAVYMRGSGRRGKRSSNRKSWRIVSQSASHTNCHEIRPRVRCSRRPPEKKGCHFRVRTVSIPSARLRDLWDGRAPIPALRQRSLPQRLGVRGDWAAGGPRRLRAARQRDARSRNGLYGVLLQGRRTRGTGKRHQKDVRSEECDDRTRAHQDGLHGSTAGRA